MRPALIESPGKQTGAVNPWAGEVFAFPATVGQQGFWYLDQIDPGNPAYNIAVRFNLKGPLQHAVLTQAINEVVRRHESLRTVVIEVDGQPVQVVAPVLTIAVPVVDLREVSAADRHARSEELTVLEARRRFGLSTGPLFRACVLQLDDLEHVLLVTVHHIISDGWSIGVISDEVGALYEAFCRGMPSPLKELPLQFGDFAVWQKQCLEGSHLDEQWTYWTTKLANLPLLEVTPDHSRPPVATSNGHIESRVLPRVLTDGLQALAGREGVTFFMLSLAVLKVLLARITGQYDIFAGTLVAGRSRVELEPLIGLFVNPLVLRTELSGDPPFRELLARVQTTVVEALAMQDLPFERIVQAVAPRRDPSRHPVFQINFIFQRDFVKPLQAADVTLTALPSRSPGAIYDLNFFMVERADGWRASCEYNTDLYESATVNRLLAQFQALMEGVLSDPARPISQVPMASPLDRESWMPAANGVAHRRTSAPRVAFEADASTYVPPRDEIEATLQEMWQRLLCVEQVSCTADFFDEGGHSLLIAKVLTETERTFGRRMPLGVFLQVRTIQGMRAFLRDERQRTARDQVLEIYAEGSRQPFIIVDMGTIYRKMLRRIDSDQRVLGLVMPELAQLPAQFAVEDIVKNLRSVMSEVRPSGPYLLGGWSHAGVIAFELARQLRESGEDVRCVILFDTNSPGYLRKFRGLKGLPGRLYTLGEKTLYHVSRLVRLKPSEAFTYTFERVRTTMAAWQLRFWRLWYRAANVPTSEHLNYSTAFQFMVVEDFHPQPSPVPLVLFRSHANQTGPFRDPHLGWDELALGGLDVYELPGNHGAMFAEPVVSELAEMLMEQLIHFATAPTATCMSKVTNAPNGRPTPKSASV